MHAALGLVLQLVVSPFATMPGVKELPADPITDSLRAAEAQFLARWRADWSAAQRPDATHLRLAALHCHFDDSWEGRPPNIIRSLGSTRSFCPIWFPVDDSLRSDESLGIDAAMSSKGWINARIARAELIAKFAAAAATHPDNPWIAGQLVRLNIDQRERGAALRAALSCRGSRSWCLLLQGYVRHEGGDPAAADSLFAHAVAAMEPQDRCEWTSIGLLLDANARAAYQRIPCEKRDSINATFWWLADPLYLEPGNSRRAEHFARQVLVRLHAALIADERWDWRPQYGGDALAAMLIRYGWPSHVYWAGQVEDGGHFHWLEFRDSSVNVAAEYTLPRFHTTPPWRAVLDPSTLTAGDWSRFTPKQAYGAGEWEPGPFPIEHVPRPAGPLLELPEQTVILRRDHDGLLAVGLDMPLRFLRAGVRLPYDAAIITARDANDRWAPAKISVALDGNATTVLVSNISAREQIISVELVPADGADGAAGRARRAVHPPPPLSALRPGEVAISDPLFFRPADGAGTGLAADEAISRMYGSLALSAKRIGIFWETYGVLPGDTVDVTLRISREDRPGVMRRLGASIGVLRADGGEIAMRWREPRLGERSGVTYAGDVPIQARSMVLDVSRLRRGRYAMEISVARPGQPPVVSRREISIH